MSAIRSLNLQTVEELRTTVRDAQLSLDELAPYNGTSPGAAAISKARARRDAAAAELARRGESA